MVYIRRWLFAAITILILLTTSCEENNLMSVIAEQEPITIRTLDEGSILLPGDPVKIAIDYNDDTVSVNRLEILLKNSDGYVIASLPDYPLNEETIPPVEIPKTLAEPGIYQWVFSLYDGITLVVEKEVIFFITEDPPYLREIKQYPPLFTTDSSGYIVAEIQDSEETDPYIRWSDSGIVLAEGLLSEGANTLLWHSPEQPGIYPLSLDIFPFPPSVELTATESFQFSSSIQSGIEVFVSTEVEPAASELGPDENYTFLYHFRGNPRNSGFTAVEETQFIGNPDFSLADDFYGYTFNQDSGLLIPRNVFPMEEPEENREQQVILQPFTLTMKMMGINQRPSISDPGSEQETETAHSVQTLLKTSFVNTLQGVTLQMIDSEILRFQFLGISSEIVFPENSENNPFEISIAVIPEEPVLQLIWYIDGKPILFDTVDYPQTGFPGKGTTTLSGSGDFAYILDEFGIYAQDSSGRQGIDPKIFYRFQKEEYGRNLVLAEGFDGLYQPEEIMISMDEPTIQNGYLQIPPGESLTLLELYPEADETLIITEEFANEGTISMRLDFQDDWEINYLVDSDNPIEVRLLGNDDTVTILPNDEENSGIETAEQGINLLFINTGEEPLLLDTILIVKTAGIE